MRILIVGATGTIGVPVVQALEVRHEVIPASHSRSALTVDLGEAESIRRLYAKVGRVDAVVSIAGQAAFRPLLALTDADFALGLNNKLMGQVNLVRFGIEMGHGWRVVHAHIRNLEQNADARKRSNQPGQCSPRRLWTRRRIGASTWPAHQCDCPGVGHRDTHRV